MDPILTKTKMIKLYYNKNNIDDKKISNISFLMGIKPLYFYQTLLWSYKFLFDQNTCNKMRNKKRYSLSSRFF